MKFPTLKSRATRCAQLFSIRVTHYNAKLLNVQKSRCGLTKKFVTLQQQESTKCCLPRYKQTGRPNKRLLEKLQTAL